MKLLTHIKCLAGVSDPQKPLRGNELAELPCIHDAYLKIEGDHIAGFGSMNELVVEETVSEITDVRNKFVLPCWCDSHTHLVFARFREEEFVDKIRGLSYAEIAARGGGILNSAARVNEMSEEDLLKNAADRLTSVIKMGTGAIEIKSGYGLSVDGELKMLRIIKKLKSTSPIPIKSTFLGAHTYPTAFKENHEAYIKQIIDEMLPVIGDEGLADYIDVFCENGFFSPEETIRICKAGVKHGLKPKIHANQLNISGGVQAGIEVNAVSVDHLESMDDEAIQALATSNTIGTLLPSAAFFLRMPFQPARKLIDAGCAIALATDFNPGSSPSGNMNLVVSMASIGMKMLPEEAINAATINGAFAMEVNKTHGSIAIGKKANLIITTEIPSLAFIPYSFGANHVERVMINGSWS